MAYGLIVAQLATAILIFAVARQAGPATFGTFSALLGSLTLVSDLVDFGRNSHALRSLTVKYDPAVVRRLLTDKLVVGAVCSSVLVAPILYATETNQWTSAIVLLTWLPLASTASAAQVGLRSQNLSKYLACVMAADRVLALSVFVLLRISSVSPTLAAALGLVAGAAASTAISLSTLSLRPDHHVSSVRHLTDAYRQARHFGAAGLTSDLQLMDVPILASVAGSVQAGLFAVPARLTGPLGILPTALTATVMHRASLALVDARERRRLQIALVKVMAIMSVGLLVFAACAPLVVPGVLGPGYRASVPMLQIYCLAMLFASYNQPTAQILQAIGRERYVSRVVGLAAVASLGAVALGGYVAGGLGATAGFTLMQLGIAAAFYPLCRDFLRDVKCRA